MRAPYARVASDLGPRRILRHHDGGGGAHVPGGDGHGMRVIARRRKPPRRAPGSAGRERQDQVGCPADLECAARLQVFALEKDARAGGGIEIGRGDDRRPLGQRPDAASGGAHIAGCDREHDSIVASIWPVSAAAGFRQDECPVFSAIRQSSVRPAGEPGGMSAGCVPIAAESAGPRHATASLADCSSGAGSLLWILPTPYIWIVRREVPNVSRERRKPRQISWNAQEKGSADYS